MGFISAVGKNILRSINDKNAENQRQKAKKHAYKKTGDKMNEAKKKHKRIDGSKTYQEELQKENRAINQRHKRREKFIDDL